MATVRVPILEDTFTTAGLTVPPVPERFARRLRQVEDWCFATRRIRGIAMYMFDELVQDAVAGTDRDYLAVSHAGHGANSYAINYFLLDGPLVLLAQTAWGGAYTNREEETTEVNDLFARCAALIDTMRSTLVPPDRRLVVVESSFRFVSRFGWLPPGMSSRDARDWLKTSADSAPKESATAGALRLLHEGDRRLLF